MVELIAYTQWIDPEKDKNPLSIAEEAACVCYDSEPTDTYRIAKGCKASGHVSPFEHTSFVFHITGVSRALLAQMSRHRHISLSVRSQRYCKEDGFMYVNPFHPGTSEEGIFNEAMESANDYYKEFTDYFLADNEDARAVLPNACCTELYMTANARALIEMSYLRLCLRSQDEIRELFQEIKREVAKVAPEIANWMVPQCEKNPKYPFCTERKSCGRHPKLDEVYKKE